jgi:hypothetical protein
MARSLPKLLYLSPRRLPRQAPLKSALNAKEDLRTRLIAGTMNCHLVTAQLTFPPLANINLRVV